MTQISEVETGITQIQYHIRKHEGLDWTTGPRYDWVLDGGRESDEYFRTVGEAREDVHTYFG